MTDLDLDPIERLILQQAAKDTGWTTITGNMHVIAFHLERRGLGDAKRGPEDNSAMFKPNDEGRKLGRVH